MKKKERNRSNHIFPKHTLNSDTLTERKSNDALRNERRAWFYYFLYLFIFIILGRHYSLLKYCERH